MRDTIAKIEALPDYLEMYIENGTIKPVEVDCGHDFAGFDSHDLKALAAEVKRLDKWRIALENLTAQGSEFHNDLDACLAYIQKQRQNDHESRKVLHKEIQLLREAKQDA